MANDCNICGVNQNASLVLQDGADIEVVGDNDIISKKTEVGNNEQFNLSLYKIPTLSLSPVPSVAEVGTTIPSVTFTGKITPQSFPITSRQLEPTVPTLDPLTVDNFTFDVNNVTSDVGGTFSSYKLTVVDGSGRTTELENGVKFQYRYYQGYSTLANLSAAQIKALANSDIEDSIFNIYGGVQNYVIPATGVQQYLYWAYPVDSPIVKSIRLGLLTFPTIELGVISIESDVKPGLFTDYRVLRSANVYGAGILTLNMVLPDDITINQIVGSGGTNLTYNDGTIESDSGTNATIPDATNTVKGLATVAQITKLEGIESGATTDQTGSEIKTAYEAELNTNAFTDSEKTKLSGIEDGATADQSGAEIKTAYEGESNTNAYTDADQTKVANIPLNKFDATAPPASTNDSGEGYSIGSRWLDDTNDILWFCKDATTSAAVWIIETQYGIQTLTDAATVIYNTNKGPKAELTSPGSNRIVDLTNLPLGVSREGYLNIKNTNGRTIQFQVAGTTTNVYIVNDGQGDTAQSTSAGATARDSFAWVWDGTDLWITYLPNFTQT